MKTVRNAFLCLLAVFGCFSLLMIVAQDQKKRVQQMENKVKALRVYEPLKLVRDGKSTVTISDLQLLDLLVVDQDCIENLASVTFASVAFRPTDGQKIKTLTNVVSIAFYDCDNVDSIILDCISDNINTILLETTSLSVQSIEMLRAAKSISVFVNGHTIQDLLD